jgi:hypothetical protein
MGESNEKKKMVGALRVLCSGMPASPSLPAFLCLLSQPKTQTKMREKESGLKPADILVRISKTISGWDYLAETKPVGKNEKINREWREILRLFPTCLMLLWANFRLSLTFKRKKCTVLATKMGHVNQPTSQPASQPASSLLPSMPLPLPFFIDNNSDNTISRTKTSNHKQKKK